MIDTLSERKMPQEDRLIDQLRGYWQRRKEVRADRERVRKEFKGLIKELERETAVCAAQIQEVKLRISNHLHALNAELKQARSPQRQTFLRRLRSEYRPLMAEAEEILRDSRKFQQDAKQREKLFKAAMQQSEFDKAAIQLCAEQLPILRSAVISQRLSALHEHIDSLVDDAIIHGEVFKRDEEYEPLIKKAVSSIDATLEQYADHLLTGEPLLLKQLKKTLSVQLRGFEQLKKACAQPENISPSPEMEEELQTRLQQLTSNVDSVLDDLMRRELNVAELTKIERRDRREAIEEVRNQVISGIFLAISGEEDVASLSVSKLCEELSELSTGCQAVDALRHKEQQAMLTTYSDIQRQVRFAIEYRGRAQDTIAEALQQLPAQATERERTLLKVAIKELSTQAEVDAAKERRHAEQAGATGKYATPINKAKVRKLVELWQKAGDSEHLQARQAQFFDKLLNRGVKYKNVWVQRKKEVGRCDQGLFGDFKRAVLAKEGYDIPGIDLRSEVSEALPGSRERVQELLGRYPRLFDDCVDYVTRKVDLEEVPKGLQNDYVGLLVAYLLENHTAAR
jgi:hypothetical protein